MSTVATAAVQRVGTGQSINQSPVGPCGGAPQSTAARATRHGTARLSTAAPRAVQCSAVQYNASTPLHRSFSLVRLCEARPAARRLRAFSLSVRTLKQFAFARLLYKLVEPRVVRITDVPVHNAACRSAGSGICAQLSKSARCNNQIAKRSCAAILSFVRAELRDAA